MFAGQFFTDIGNVQSLILQNKIKSLSFFQD